MPAEVVLGRLMFPAMGRWGRNNWKEGESAWTVDYPLGDRNYLRHLRRLSTVDVRSVEQPVDLDDEDDVFNWPFLLASFVGEWNLTQAQAARLREYLLRGGGPGYRRDGVDPHWRAILDDDGRIMVAITFNNDLGDAWQYANVAEYPQEDTNLGIRLGVNFAIYAMTH